jgi:hypothetical protein
MRSAAGACVVSLRAHRFVPSCSARIAGLQPTDPWCFWPSKNPRRSGEGSGRFGLASLALVPASSLPPGAGNEYEYALNTQLYRAEQTEEGYVDQAEVLDRHLHATTVRLDGDGDVAAVPAIEQTQPDSP